MKKLVIGILAFLGVLSILGLLAAAGIWMLSGLTKPGVSSDTILEVDFERGLIETIPDDPFAQMMLENTLTVRDVVDAIDRGAEDQRVRALIARIGAGGTLIAHAQEIRDAVQRFRDAGKPAIAFSETFGEWGPGNGGYYLATAFDEIYLQPSGDIGLTGVIFNSMFVRGALDKLDVEPRFGQRYEYKNAMNMYTEKAFTEPHREAMQHLVDGMMSQMVRGIAAGRGLSEEHVRELVDLGPFIGAEATEAGLVDGLKYRDEVYGLLRERVGEDADLLYIDRYLDRAGRPHSKGETVALIHAFGTVVRGKSAYSPVDGSITMGSDTVAGAIRAAVNDKRVKAILLRVDSPGGSYVASDTVWRETVRAKEEGKLVVVSMGNLAASGGYFVSMHADKIVAQPGTITASIGVLSGKLLTRKLWDRVGINWDAVQVGANADFFDFTFDFTERGSERFNAGLDRVYEDFTGKVADGRGMPLERVQQLAKGRIWTGEDALESGLVDALGGIDVALQLIREGLELDADAPLKLKRFPAKRSTFDMLLSDGPDSSEAAALRSLAQSLRAVQPAVRTLRQATGTTEGGVLSMPEVTPGE